MLLIRRFAGIAITILAIQFTTSAQKQPTTALQLNDYLAGMTDSLYKQGIAWGEEFNLAKSKKDFGSLTPLREKLVSYIDRKLMDVLLLKDINGSEKLRLSFMDMLFFEKRMINESFQPFESLNINYTDQKFNEMLENLTKASQSERTYLAQIADEQRIYAEKNGFTIAEE